MRRLLQTALVLILALVLPVLLSDINRGTPRHVIAAQLSDGFALVDLQRALTVAMYPGRSAFQVRWRGNRLFFSEWVQPEDAAAHFDLFVQQPAQEPRQLLDSLNSEVFMAATPDGERLLYFLPTEDTLMLLAPGEPPRRMYQGKVEALWLSPGGDWLAIDRIQESGRELYLIETQAGTAQGVGINGRGRTVRWSANTLAFTVSGTGNQSRLALLPLDTLVPTYVAARGSVEWFEWYPDEERLLFLATDQNWTSTLYSVSVDDLTPRPVLELPGLARRVAWSPDRERIAVTVNPSGATGYDLYLYEDAQLVSVEIDAQLSAVSRLMWSDDGNWLYIMDGDPTHRLFLALHAPDHQLWYPPLPPATVWVHGWWTPDA